MKHEIFTEVEYNPDMLISGAIFDIDGTLLDSMPAWNSVVARVLARNGLEAEADLGDKLFANTIHQTADYLLNRYGLGKAYDHDGMVRAIDMAMKGFYDTEAELKPGARRLLDHFFRSGVPMTIVTSTDRECFADLFRRLGLDKYFCGIFTCSETGFSKSEPGIFELAVERMASSKQSTFLFEDGLYSLRTGKRTGLKTVGIYDSVSRKDQGKIQDICDLYLPEGAGLDELAQLTEAEDIDEVYIEWPDELEAEQTLFGMIC